MKSLLGYTPCSFIIANSRGTKASGTAKIHAFRPSTEASCEDNLRKPRAKECMHNVVRGGIPVTSNGKVRTDHDVDEGAVVWLCAFGISASSVFGSPPNLRLPPEFPLGLDCFCREEDILEHLLSGRRQEEEEMWR